jgi:peptidoglycan hydrolase CwlO-like protein
MSEEQQEAGKEDNTLAKIKKDFQKRGGKLPSESERKSLLATYKAAVKKADDLTAELAKAETAKAEAVKKLAEAFGGASLKIDGVVHDFRCRGETIYIRKQQQSDVIEL